MKIRSGFVSNSSSSSYVIVIEKEAYDQMYSQLSNIQKDIISFLRDGRVCEFGSGQAVVIQYVSGNCSTLENYCLGDGDALSAKAFAECENDRFDWCEEWESIQLAIKKLPKNTVIWSSTDM